jgi:hypothetical protein
VSKHLLIRVIFMLLMAVGASAINAQEDDSAATGAGLRNTQVNSASARMWVFAMSKGDIVDLLVEVPQETIQSAQ